MQNFIYNSFSLKFLNSIQPPASTKPSKIFRWRPKNRHVATLIEVELSTNLNSQLKLKTTTEEEIIRNIFNLYSASKKSHFILINYTKEFSKTKDISFLAILVWYLSSKSVKFMSNQCKITSKLVRNEFDGKMWAFLANQIWHQNQSGKTKWNRLLQINHSSNDDRKLAPVKIWRFNTKCIQGKTDLSLLFTIFVWKCWFMESRESRQVDKAGLEK